MKNWSNKFLILAVCMIVVSCNKQQKKDEKLVSGNIVVIKKIKKDYLKKIGAVHVLNEKIQFFEGDTIVELKDQGDSYVEKRRKKDESIFNFFVYSKRNNGMISSGTKFYDMLINVFRKYDRNGRVTEERNTNKDFAFSVYEVIEKIKKTHKINLNDGNEKRHVLRGFDNELNKSIYTINYDFNKNSGFIRYITVDGSNGAILSSGNKTLLD